LKARRPDGDLLALAALGALSLLRFVPDRLRGLAPYWGDLSYLHVPWRSYDSELLAAGRLPLWNPFLYFGMPQAATMQDSLYYPGTVPFFILRFADALALYHFAHYWLAAAFVYLWLRAGRASKASAFGGAVVAAFSGLMLSREPFLNHLAVLALAPALALFFTRPAALAAALALAFFAGYPPFLVGAALTAWAMALAGRGAGDASFWKRAALCWTLAGAASAVLGAVLLLPAAELVGLSRRAGGMAADETLAYGFSPADLGQWLSPLLVKGFNPAVEWWKSCYLGFAGAAAAAAGLFVVTRRRAAALGGFLLLVLILILGGSNPVSAALWERLPPLRFIRYPGNTAYLALLPLAALAAAGLSALRGRARLLACAALCAELVAVAWGAMPRASAALFASKGPLAADLQATLEGRRYLLSPRALNAGTGSGPWDWRWRLYGLTNAPVKLRAAANFGEPLTPRPNYALMDRLFSASGPQEIMPLLPWLDVGVMLTPVQGKPAAPGRRPLSGPLWDRTPVPGAAGARLLSAADGEALPPEIAVPPRTGKILEVERPREDAVSISGAGAGWVFAAEPQYPGWTLWLETERGPGLSRALPALGPFQKTSVPAGPWALHWRYEPASFKNGFLLTLFAAGLFCAYWYNRARSLP
jgi:hypothetical protein